MNNHHKAGLIGLAITIPLWLLTSWRLVFHFGSSSSETNGDNGPTASQWWTLRRRFHVFLWFATLCETLAYADFAGLIGNKLKEKEVYLLLDLMGRSIFEFLAYTCVTELWLQTALQASRTVSVHFQGSLLTRTFNRVVGFMSILLSVILGLYLLWTPESLAQIEKTELLFRMQILMEALCWAVATAFVVMCIRVTAERIHSSFSTFPPSSTMERVSLQCQALVPMVVCAVCYSVRSFFLICRMIGESPLFVATTRFHPIWWVLFVWTPTLLVVICALYSARRRDRFALDSDDAYVPLLGPLPPVPPPAEAFRNFRRFTEGMMSPLTGSPAKESNNNHAVNVSMQRLASEGGETTNLGDFTVI